MLVDEIQVAGNELFRGNLQGFKDAIDYYADGLRRNGEWIMYRPKIDFNAQCTLRFDQSKKVFYSYGEAAVAPEITGGKVCVSNARSEVLLGLRKFAIRNDVRELTIVFPDQSTLVFQKDGSAISVYGTGLVERRLNADYAGN